MVPGVQALEVLLTLQSEGNRSLEITLISSAHRSHYYLGSEGLAIRLSSLGANYVQNGESPESHPSSPGHSGVPLLGIQQARDLSLLLLPAHLPRRPTGSHPRQHHKIRC